MTLSNNIHTYGDVRRILDMVVRGGGGEYRLNTPEAKHKFRARAYKFRGLAQAAGEHQYNDIIITQPRDKPTSLVFKITKVEGTFITPEGESLEGLETSTASEETFSEFLNEDIGQFLSEMKED